MATANRDLNPRKPETITQYWTVWATHVENHSTLVQTANACGYSVGQVCRILKWCAKQLAQDPVEIVQGQVWNKLRRLRAIQPKREQVMGEDNHQAAIGYLREERELENDIAKLQGAERHLVELTGTVDLNLTWWDGIAAVEAADGTSDETETADNSGTA